MAQYIANEDSVELVHAFNSPGFPNGGGYNPKVRHYDSKKNYLDIVQTGVESLGTRWEADPNPSARNKKYSFRVTNAAGHGGGDTFPDAFSEAVRWPMIRAVQRQDDGVVSYSNNQIDHYFRSKQKRAQARRVMELSKLKGSYFDPEDSRNHQHSQYRYGVFVPY